MAHFINTKETLVTEAVDGFLRTAGAANLARLDGYPQIKVVVATDAKANRVALVSGGGSGHEPAHAGFVGKGMLAAAVCGEVFASPSVDAVLNGILAVTGDAGCLLIVKNYTGDRLNFGLAAEKARTLGRKVEMVVVGDDIALPDIIQPRGVAGTLFVHKIAGHVAAKGAKLAKVAQTARAVADAVVSLGMSLSSCSIPGVAGEDRVPDGKAELGLGIHGEPGVELVDYKGARETAAILTDKLFAAVKPAKSYALLLNNLGSTTPLEMSVIANEMLAHPKGKKIRLVVGPALLMTSLDMHGLSASLLPLTDEWEEALSSPVAPAAWPGAHPVQKPAIVKLPKEAKPAAVKASRNPVLAGWIEAACDALITAEADLNALDSKVGDGDTGSTMAGAARRLKAGLGKMPLADTGAAFAAISSTLSTTMGGSSGVLLAILFAAAGVAAKDGMPWAKALQAGLARMQHYGGAKTGDRTMIDALEPALAALVGGKSLKIAADAARKGAEATKRMQAARAGRSAYVSAKNLDGIADPGAEAVARLIETLAAR
ncbi:MAG: dihydroxyacetone kinase subunit DhaK [Rhizobiaceae bacterium]|jgi:dihydroxyacetone kinase|nr:dihydroxyacetone kinase subunit DhaK [Rhizobiaceae bacterium]